MWAISSALHDEGKKLNRVQKYKKYINELNFEGIKFPVTLNQVAKFEKQNAAIAVNVYMLSLVKGRYIVSPCHASVKSRDLDRVNLLLVQDTYIDEDQEDCPEITSVPRFHNVWIKNLSRLLSKQIKIHKGSAPVCDRCLRFVYSAPQFEKHERDCALLNKCRIELPDERNNILKFTNYRYQNVVPYVL